MSDQGFQQRTGIGHRMIDLRIENGTTAVGWLEDDFHHFGVTVVHDGAVVTAVRMAAPRTPWTACPGAAEPLKALIGKPLITRASEIGALIEMRLQCTHVFDLTGLLLAHIAKRATRAPQRRYHTVIPDRPRHSADHVISSFGPGRAELFQDGELVMYWDIDGEFITGPAPYGGHSQNAGFRAWTESMPEQEAEYATILRRAILVAGGRTMNHDDYPSAGAMNTPPVCHAFQPQRRDLALRNMGNTWDYSDRPQDLLTNVHQIP
jgi:hypothetical protein